MAKYSDFIIVEYFDFDACDMTIESGVVLVQDRASERVRFEHDILINAEPLLFLLEDGFCSVGHYHSDIKGGYNIEFEIDSLTQISSMQRSMYHIQTTIGRREDAITCSIIRSALLKIEQNNSNIRININ